ncbi:hypothetical protein BZG36_03979 [Bifiguratus adelaidae]|uniref:Nudix hydrolase domain-containing protein n=1 Tax=Bifiguratus adelaidae TaxID=1938954 RepID=A0A261XXD3_9FUNG|nr:hypothetical protein BZG36_03979 [Bifiguratus adelaidae]
MSHSSLLTHAVLTRLANYAPPPDTLDYDLRAAVLLPLFVNRHGGLDIILTVRALSMRRHAGEVALPGGGVEPEDKTMVDTALREAYEEIGLEPNQQTVLCCLRPFFSRHLTLVTPVVSLVHSTGADADLPFVPRLAKQEVSAVFTVPLDRVLSKRGWEYNDIEWFGRPWRIHRFHGPHREDEDAPVIWGLTGQVLIHAAKVAYGYHHPHEEIPQVIREHRMPLEVEEWAEGLDPNEDWEVRFLEALRQGGIAEPRRLSSRM